MDTILISVITLLLVITVALGIWLARLLRAERLRSDARVERLTELAESRHVHYLGGRAHELELRPELDLRAEEDVASARTELFQPPEETAAWPRRLAAAGAIAVVVGAVVFGWTVVRDDVGLGGATQAEQILERPLELVSLSHAERDGGLTITGLVQNPRGAAVLTRVQATVLVFGADGALLSSGRAPLDFATLPPGDESPFVIRVPVTGAARYRVGFRNEADQPISHVDRRSSAAMVAKEAR